MKKNRLLKGVFISLALLIVLLWAGGLFLNNYIESRLLSQEIYGYKTDSVEVNVNLFKLSITLNNILLNADSSDSKLRIKKFRVGGLNPFKIFFNDEISTSNISIEGIDVFFQPSAHTKLQKKGTSKSKKDFKIFTQNLSVDVDSFVWLDSNSTASDTLLYVEARFSGTKLAWDQGSNDTAFPVTYHSLMLTVPYARLAVSDSLYYLDFFNLELNTEDSVISMQLVKLGTNYERYEIGNVTGLQRDWLDLSWDGINIYPVNFPKALSDTALIAGAVRIERFEARAFKDRRRTFPDKPDTKLPDALMRSIPVGLGIDSLVIQSGYVEYAERVEGSSAEGLVTFNNLKATLVNIGNKARYLKAPTRLTASAMFMDKAYLNASFDLPNPAFKKKYKVIGALHEMPLKSLNNILQQSAGAEVVTGNLERLDFNFIYNNDVSDGELAFQYTDLKVKLINKSDQSEKKILSAIVNRLVVPTNNIAANDDFKKGEIHFERDKKKSIFNFWWKSILSGIKSTML